VRGHPVEEVVSRGNVGMKGAGGDIIMMGFCRPRECLQEGVPQWMSTHCLCEAQLVQTSLKS